MNLKGLTPLNIQFVTLLLMQLQYSTPECNFIKLLQILAMVEEAAGTRMYKSKKEISVKVLEKKDLKLAEMDRQLKDELEPKISKLREERQQYQELLKLMREADQLSRVHLAFKFFQAEVNISLQLLYSTVL